MATRLFIDGLPATENLRHPRSISFVLIGLHAYMETYGGDATVRRMRQELAGKLHDRFLKNATAVILQNHVDDLASERYLKKMAKMLDVPILLRADGASTVLRDEQLVTLDPDQAIIYKGIV